MQKCMIRITISSAILNQPAALCTVVRLESSDRPREKIIIPEMYKD